MQETVDTLQRSLADGLQRRALLPTRDGRAQPEALAAAAAAADPDERALFDCLDLVYLLHILHAWPHTAPETRARWWRAIVARQDGRGWFHARDRQRHSPVHVTAYALGALRLLAGPQTEALGPHPRAPHGLCAIGPDEAVGRAGRAALGPLERLHFWRGSHRAGGVVAIQALLAEPVLGGAGTDAVTPALRALVADWMAASDAATGCWTLAPAWQQRPFDLLFALRHAPPHCRLGAAAHIYWPAARLGVPCAHPRAALDAVAIAQRPDGRFENTPYCLDYDGLFIARHALRSAEGGRDDMQVYLTGIAAGVRANIERAAIDGRLWARGVHGMVGALAALALAGRVLDGDAGEAPRLADPLEETWWL